MAREFYQLVITQAIEQRSVGHDRGRPEAIRRRAQATGYVNSTLKTGRQRRSRLRCLNDRKGAQTVSSDADRERLDSLHSGRPRYRSRAAATD